TSVCLECPARGQPPRGCVFFFFQAEDGIRYFHVTGVQTCALPISLTSDVGACRPYPESRLHDTIGSQTQSAASVARRTGGVRTRPTFMYWPQVIFWPLPASTWSQRRVASDPMGVNLGPRSLPTTFA